MRMITRSDFDGLICALLLKKAGVIDSWEFVHPKDLQDGKFTPTEDDVLANVPYVPGCGMWFDHHTSEDERVGWTVDVKGESRREKSAARVIYDYYGGAEKFPNCEEMMIAVDKVDSGDLTVDEIMNPTGWILIGFISDPRTGLGRFREFTISNYQLMEKLINYCIDYTAEQILSLPDVVERVELYMEQTEKFKVMVNEHTKIDGNIIITDLRNVETIYTGNRFMVYSMFPEQNISLWIVDGRQKQNVAIACGYSILNRSCTTNVGNLMLKYGGGGHEMVGTCQVPYDDADKYIAEIVESIKKDCE